VSRTAAAPDGEPCVLRAALLAQCPAAAGDPRVDDLIRFALNGTAAPPDMGGASAPFVGSIARLRLPDPTVDPGHLIVDETLDFLGETHDWTAWTPAQWLNFLMLGRIGPRRRAAVVATMRDDGIYVLEWIAHYRALGFEHLFIYTNDNADGSEILLRQLADLEVITLIESETSGRVSPEVKAFNHAVHLLHALRDYEWVLFVDSDEYLVPAPAYGMSVAPVLDALDRRYPDGSAAAIAYQWLWYNSAMIFERQPGLLAERFQYATPYRLTKSLVRLRDVLSMRRQHLPELRPGCIVVDSAFNPLDIARPLKEWSVEYGGGRINHYWPKSFEEFSLKKARGDALKLTDNLYARDFRLFFEWNGPDTPETYHPADPAFLDAVRCGIAELRAMPGVAAAEAEVERGFRRLLGRYDDAGGLSRIYETYETVRA
jgi:hypothetical protein